MREIFCLNTVFERFVGKCILMLHVILQRTVCSPLAVRDHAREMAAITGALVRFWMGTLRLPGQ